MKRICPTGMKAVSPEDVERSLLTLASMYGMGREADQKELETMRETLHRLLMDEPHVEQTTENNNERTATWQESSRLSQNGLSQ